MNKFFNFQSSTIIAIGIIIVAMLFGLSAQAQNAHKQIAGLPAGYVLSEQGDTIFDENVYYESLMNDTTLTMNKEVALGEATVTGHRPMTKIKDGAFVTRVEGSVLEKVGNARDVLGRVPGIIKNGDDLEVIGKGSPVYYINGRKVRDLDELKRIQSDQIKDIEVITNPGAAYDATVTAVVRIKTVRQQGEGWSVGVSAKDEQSFKHGVNDPEVQVDINYRWNKFDIFAMAKEWKWDSFQEAVIGKNVENSLVKQVQEGDLNGHWQGNGSVFNAGFNFMPNDKHSLGAKVDYWVNTKSDNNMTSNLRIESWPMDAAPIVEDDSRSDTHSYDDNPYGILGNMYYNGTFGKLNVDFNADLFMNSSTSHSTSIETSKVQNYTNPEFSNISSTSNNLYATKLVFSYPVWKGQLQVGTEETIVRRNEEYNVCTSQVDIIGVNNTESRVEDDNYAGFVQYNASIPSKREDGSWGWNFGAGVRFEHASFHYKDLKAPAGSEFADFSRSYDNFFPSANIMTSYKGAQLMASYSIKTVRPSFDMLNGTMSYISRYILNQGNPLVKPMTLHNADFSTRYKWFGGTISYQYMKDAISSWSSIYNEQGTVLVSTKNMEEPAHRFMAFFNAAPTFGIYHPTYVAGVVAQKFSMDTENGRLDFNQPMWFVNVSNVFTFKHAWQAECNMNYTSRGESMNIYLYKHSFTTDLAIQKSFLKNNALTLRLVMQDIFDSQRQGVQVYYGSFNITQTNRFDNQRLIFTLRYNFNATRSKYRGTGAGQETRSRISTGQH